MSPLMPAVAGPTVGNQRDGIEHREDGAGGLGDSGGGADLHLEGVRVRTSAPGPTVHPGF